MAPGVFEINGMTLQNAQKTGSKPGQYTSTCPFCGKNGKFYFNTLLKKYICFSDSCGRCGSFSDGETTEWYQDSTPIDEMRQRLLAGKKKGSKVIDLDLISQPINDETPAAKEYLAERKFTPELVVQHHIVAGKNYVDKNGVDDRKWVGRVLFPFFSPGGDCRYVLGRDYTGMSKAKYINEAMPKSGVLYGLDNVRGDAIICEGLISAIAATRGADVPAVAFLGRYMTTDQAYLLKSRANRIWLSLDGGVEKQTNNKILRSLIEWGFDEVFYVRLPDGMDPDDVTPDQYRACFTKAKKVWFL